MFRDISWIFFDVGSTLVDERAVYERRFRQMAEQAGKPWEEIDTYARDCYRQGKKGDKEAAKHFAVALPQWTSEDEILYPDTLSCLEVLSCKYKIGIIANQLPGCEERLRKLGVLPYLSLLVSSAEEAVSKPDARIFEIALKRSGCPVEKAVMIGDRIDNDILPAKDLGMKTIWIRQGFGSLWPDRCNEADAAVSSLTELCEFL